MANCAYLDADGDGALSVSDLMQVRVKHAVLMQNRRPGLQTTLLWPQSLRVSEAHAIKCITALQRDCGATLAELNATPSAVDVVHALTCGSQTLQRLVVVASAVWLYQHPRELRSPLRLFGLPR
jgi:hypothetical protein